MSWQRLPARIAETIALGLPGADPAAVKLPARAHGAALYRPGPEAPPPASAFPLLLGAPLVASVSRQGDRLLFAFSLAFYTACIREIQADLPPANGDLGSLALNRCLALSRHGGSGCPPFPAARRALLLCLCAGERPGGRALAEAALLGLFDEVPPRDRAPLSSLCGPLGDACARLLTYYLSQIH